MFATLSSNQIATWALKGTFGDSVFDLYEKDDLKDFYYEFTLLDKKYVATLSLNGADKINVYEKYDDDDEILVEKDIPYFVLRVENNGNTIYNICDYI